MTHLEKLRSDPRTVDELINTILAVTDEDILWNAIAVLHVRGSAGVLDRARELCRSMCQRERSLGATILAQLGCPERTFPKECVDAILGLIEVETEPEVLHDAFVALGHQSDPRAIAAAGRFDSHPDPEVRYALVFSLLGYSEAVAVELLIGLSQDEDSDVRDWAAFGLGTQIDLDTPEIREALAARLDDSDEYTRGEALIGLARRKDARAVPFIEFAWSSEEIGDKAREAAELLGISVNTFTSLECLDPPHSPHISN